MTCNIKIPRLFIRWLLPLLALLCLGWSDSWDGIQSGAGSVTSVQADFIQKKYLPILEKPLLSTGVFYYQAPRSLRWEYRDPIRSILLMHEGRVRRFVADSSGFRKESSAGLQSMQIVLEDIGQWLKGRFDQNPMFAARLLPDRKIILTPREDSMSAVIDRIELNLAPQPGVIRSVLIYENEDSFTEMIFSHTVLNKTIAAELFTKDP
jgi:outer membrane lipoprotein-sorting protein